MCFLKISNNRKVDNECMVFQQEWTSKNVFIEVSGKAVCLVCKESIAVLKYSCRMWQGMQTITDYKVKHSCELPSDTSLPDELNKYARFKASNTATCMRALAVPDDCVIPLSSANVSKTLKTGQHSQGHRARWITRMCTPCMRGPTGKCLP